MSKCGICQREQQKFEDAFMVEFGDVKFKMPGYNFNMLTSMQGINICEDCMDSYCKIHALETGIGFSRAGVEYYADGRNLKDDSNTDDLSKS